MRQLMAIPLVGMCLLGQPAKPPKGALDSKRLLPSPSMVLAKIISDHELFQRAENPIQSALEGDRGALSRLPGISKADQSRQETALLGFKQRLDQIPSASLHDEDLLNHTFLRRVIELSLEELKFDSSRLGFSNEGGPEGLLAYLAATTVIRTKSDAEAYIARLEAMPKFISDTTENMRRGVRDGFVQSRATTEAVLPQLQAGLASPFTPDGGAMAPLAKLPESFPAPEQQALRAQARSILETKVRPAQAAFVKTVVTEVLPVAKPKIGALHLPGGKDYYAFLARYFTTTSLSPDAIHEIGLREIARIRVEMDREIMASGFKGMFPEFLTFLRTDPRFYATSREDLLEKSARLAKRADDELPKLFEKLPRLPYGVREVPREIEENYTTGRYNGGSPQLGISGGLMINTSHLDQRPLYEQPALVLHEGVPGHHLQIAIQQEMADQPWFRRQAEVTAFIEGWALYAESLGHEMGMYRDPYERFGRLSMEMWRACRLVADTGIHSKGWTLEQARACFAENSALSAKNIENEIQRYISGPGQALAYKIGELKIRELRKRAETELGPKFDLRRFHDTLLWTGPLPLDLLEARVGDWIVSRSKYPPAEPGALVCEPLKAAEWGR